MNQTNTSWFIFFCEKGTKFPKGFEIGLIIYCPVSAFGLQMATNLRWLQAHNSCLNYRTWCKLLIWSNIVSVCVAWQLVSLLVTLWLLYVRSWQSKLANDRANMEKAETQSSHVLSLSNQKQIWQQVHWRLLLWYTEFLLALTLDAFCVDKVSSLLYMCFFFQSGV